MGKAVIKGHVFKSKGLTWSPLAPPDFLVARRRTLPREGERILKT